MTGIIERLSAARADRYRLERELGAGVFSGRLPLGTPAVDSHR